MSYILSGLGSTSSKPFVLTPVLDGDSFVSLFAAYKSAFPAGTTAQQFAKAVCAANGIPFTVSAIEAWIFGMSRRRLPFVASDNPGMHGGPKGVGWSTFAAGNKIMLPDIPRPGVTPAPAPAPLPPPPPSPVPDVIKSETVQGRSPLLFVAAGGLILLALFGGGGGKKQSEGAALKTSRPVISRFKT